VTPLGDKPGWLRVELKGSANGVSPKGLQDNSGILKAMINAKIPILSIQPDGGRLQDVFLNLTEDSIK
jgi:hypothetical protein